ncbi:MAG: helix-turn-helix transcriptional regulator [Lachnospiraceae bacterium]|nr:helix-turn-helix transcriptional regulator [Lachnospiraceae bacterium]MBQ5473144.1 helix-turn-helix transcriptional regulator [Lachnospiraceae bacterium]
MDICLRFGIRCKQLREKMNLSQEKFALLIEMDRTYYSSIENGRRNVSIRNIEKIATGFGITIEELMRGV